MSAWSSVVSFGQLSTRVTAAEEVGVLLAGELSGKSWAIVRDGVRAFVGSQSLRKVELDARREVGVIVRDPKVTRRIAAVFEADWALTDLAKKEAGNPDQALSA